MLLASKTRRRFASFYEAFAFFLKEDFNLLGTMRAKWDVDLSSLRPGSRGGADDFATAISPGNLGKLELAEEAGVRQTSWRVCCGSRVW